MHSALKDIPESEVIKQVKSVIAKTGLKLQRINTGCFSIGEGKNKRFIKTAEAGTCDFEGYDNYGRFLAIECKRPVGGKISPAQEARIADINDKGGVAFVAHSGEEAMSLLNVCGCLKQKKKEKMKKKSAELKLLFAAAKSIKAYCQNVGLKTKEGGDACDECAFLKNGRCVFSCGAYDWDL